MIKSNAPAYANKPGKYSIKIVLTLLLLLCFAALIGCDKNADEPRLILGVTTTLQDSGLLKPLSEALEKQADLLPMVAPKIIVAPSGKILRLAVDGEVDLIITHHPQGEQALKDSGNITAQQALMFNEFVLVGPRADPAHVSTSIELDEALKKIAQKNSMFISRADDSGTHQFEKMAWQKANIIDYKNSVNTGAAMADTLRVALERSAYTLVDKATWLALAKETGGFTVLFEDSQTMTNVYQVSLLGKQPKSDAQALYNWLISNEGKVVMTSLRINGQQVFYSSLKDAQ